MVKVYVLEWGECYENDVRWAGTDLEAAKRHGLELAKESPGSGFNITEWDGHRATATWWLSTANEWREGRV